MIARPDYSDCGLELDEFQRFAITTSLTTSERGGLPDLAYYSIGLFDESGEVAGKIKKLYRDYAGLLNPELRAAIALELGDVLWYLAMITTEIGFSLKQIAMWDSQFGFADDFDGLPDMVRFAFRLAASTAKTTEEIDFIFTHYRGEPKYRRVPIGLSLSYVLRWLSVIAQALGYQIGDIARMNNEKLLARKAQGLIHGNGDNRQKEKG